MRIPSPEEIEAAKTPRGGWTKARLAEWGVPWPPPSGWRRRLIGAWKKKARAAEKRERKAASRPSARESDDLMVIEPDWP